MSLPKQTVLSNKPVQIRRCGDDVDSEILHRNRMTYLIHLTNR